MRRNGSGPFMNQTYKNVYQEWLFLKNIRLKFYHAILLIYLLIYLFTFLFNIYFNVLVLNPVLLFSNVIKIHMLINDRMHNIVYIAEVLCVYIYCMNLCIQ